MDNTPGIFQDTATATSTADLSAVPPEDRLAVSQRGDRSAQVNTRLHRNTDICPVASWRED